MLALKRFLQEYWQLIKLHLIRNKRALFFTIAAYVVTCILCYRNSDYIYANRELVVVAIICLSAIYTLFVSMNDYYRHRRVYSAQLLPASHKAKFLSEITISLVIIPLVLSAISTVIDLGVFLKVDNEVYDCPLKSWNWGYANWLVIPATTYILIAANSVATLMKTQRCWEIVAMLVISFLALLIMDKIGVMDNYPGVDCYFRPIRNINKSSYTSVVVHSAWAGPYVTLWATRIWLWALPIALYVWAYFRFKEWSSR